MSWPTFADDTNSNRVERAVYMACLMEATARKPGNVHPAASFDDLTYADFVASAAAVAPVLAHSAEAGVGNTVLEAVRATSKVAPSNTNLGIILLLAPLCATPHSQSLETGVGEILHALDINDAIAAYEAIRLANPGGMGQSAEADVSAQPEITLLQAMCLAADRDSIAAQYQNGYQAVFQVGLPLLANPVWWPNDWETAVITLHLTLMSQFPDTLIARKCGREEACHAAKLAQGVLENGGPTSQAGKDQLNQLDLWLRERGNQRNPGATADLVTACLFAALREQQIQAPTPATLLSHGQQISHAQQ